MTIEEIAKLIGNVSRVLKEVSIDCHLNHELTKFSEKSLSKILDNNVFRVA